MKILQIAPLSWPMPVTRYGGVERVVEWLSIGLAELGHEVWLAAPRGSRPGPWRLIELPLRPVGARYHRQKYGEACRYLATETDLDFDIVHGHSPGTGQPPVGDGAAELRRHSRLPLLITTHGRRERILPAGTATTAFISHSQRLDSGRPEAPFIHNPIHPDGYIFQEHKGDYLLWMSRVNWSVKGLDLAIELARRTGMPLVIAGPGMGWVARLRLPRRVSYVGEVSGVRKARLLAGARAFVHTATWPEPFGLVFLEAAVSGTGVLAFAGAGAADEVIEPGLSGFLCKDLDEMAARVADLGSLDPAACRARALERFDRRIIAAAYLTLYRQVIAAC
jgi:glycosyltransferase involved in cell wall biosynthesis